MTGTEIPLGGGNMSSGVVRVGAPVRRPAGPWTPAVHALLTHLHEAGFRGAPRPLGIDDRGREILTFVPGPGGGPRPFHPLAARGARPRAAPPPYPRVPRRRHRVRPAAGRTLAGAHAGRRRRDHRAPRPGTMESRHR